jgi:hypothetical protein
MVDLARHVQFNVNHYDIIVHDNQGKNDNNDNDNQNAQNNQKYNDQAGQVVQPNVLAGAQATLAFKVEQSKIPNFMGRKARTTLQLSCSSGRLMICYKPTGGTTPPLTPMWPTHLRILLGTGYLQQLKCLNEISEAVCHTNRRKTHHR